MATVTPAWPFASIALALEPKPAEHRDEDAELQFVGVEQALDDLVEQWRTQHVAVEPAQAAVVERLNEEREVHTRSVPMVCGQPTVRAGLPAPDSVVEAQTIGASPSVAARVPD